MRRIATLLSLVAAAFWLGAPAAGAGDEPGPMKTAPSQVSPGAPGSSTAVDRQSATDDVEYVVVEGDTLTSIAEEQLGSAAKWKLIAQANGIDDPRSLRAGQKLKLPDTAPSDTRL